MDFFAIVILMKTYWRSSAKELLGRLMEPAGLLQIIIGPRQVGKTTALTQILTRLKRKGASSILASADALSSPPGEWISQQWNKARGFAKERFSVLAFDELQKIPGWSEIVKREFDADARLNPQRRPRIVISGSSALMIEKGLMESLAGRFEIIRFPHWNLAEESRAFGISLSDHIALGGYPRLHDFLPDVPRFLSYVADSIIESVLNKDLLLLHPVEKPALLRRLFDFSCHHPAEIVSLQKMLGQLTDKGNVTTLAHYLDLLSKAFLIVPIQKYSPEILRVRSSSPKLVVMAQALLAAIQRKTPAALLRDPALYGRWAENAVGAHLIKAGLDVFYWRDRDLEIDFVAKKGSDSLAVEVGVSMKKRSGEIKALARRCGANKAMLVGPRGVTLEEFLKTDPSRWF